jgi:hypothetical protein
MYFPTLSICSAIQSEKKLQMKKILLKLVMGVSLLAVPSSLWATPPQIKVQDPTIQPTATVSWWSYLVSVFTL